MKEWHPDKKRRFRGEVLKLLAARHGAQQSRMDDTALTHALVFYMAWDVSVKDVVTILQEMDGRGWVKYRSLYNNIVGRTELTKIEITPDGQDLVDQTTHNPAVSIS